jgi:hypothetical protein
MIRARPLAFERTALVRDDAVAGTTLESRVLRTLSSPGVQEWSVATFSHLMQVPLAPSGNRCSDAIVRSGGAAFELIRQLASAHRAARKQNAPHPIDPSFRPGYGLAKLAENTWRACAELSPWTIRYECPGTNQNDFCHLDCARSRHARTTIGGAATW